MKSPDYSPSHKKSVASPSSECQRPYPSPTKPDIPMKPDFSRRSQSRQKSQTPPRNLGTSRDKTLPAKVSSPLTRVPPNTLRLSFKMKITPEVLNNPDSPSILANDR